jgi:hypothetical protein
MPIHAYPRCGGTRRKPGKRRSFDTSWRAVLKERSWGVSVAILGRDRRMELLGKWVVLVGLGSVACGPGARMVVPSDLANQSRVLEVEDRSRATGLLANEGFKLGSYVVDKVDRDWDSSSSAGSGAYSAGKKTTGYTFRLQAGSTSWHGSCASLAKEQSVGSLSFGFSTKVTCACQSAGKKATLKIGGQTEATGGTFESGGKTYLVTAIEETDKSYFGDTPAGYRLDEGDKPFAAVEVLHPGRVWLNTDMSEEEAASTSCALAGVMLYRPPSDD